MTKGLYIDVKPKDIIGPISALLGLLVIAIGFLHNAQIPSYEARDLTSTIMSAIFVFIITALMVVAFTFTGNMELWEFSLRLYLVSWITFGCGMIIMTFALTSGVFVIPINSQNGFDLSSFTPIVAGVGTVGAAYYYLISPGHWISLYVRKNVQTTTDLLNLNNQVTNIINENGGDPLNAFLHIYGEIESLLKSIKEKERLKSKDYRNYTEMIFKCGRMRKLPLSAVNALDYLKILHGNVLKGSITSEYTLISAVQACLIARRDLIRILEWISERAKCSSV